MKGSQFKIYTLDKVDGKPISKLQVISKIQYNNTDVYSKPIKPKINNKKPPKNLNHKNINNTNNKDVNNNSNKNTNNNNIIIKEVEKNNNKEMLIKEPKLIKKNYNNQNRKNKSKSPFAVNNISPSNNNNKMINFNTNNTNNNKSLQIKMLKDRTKSLEKVKRSPVRYNEKKNGNKKNNKKKEKIKTPNDTLAQFNTNNNNKQNDIFDNSTGKFNFNKSNYRDKSPFRENDKRNNSNNNNTNNYNMHLNKSISKEKVEASIGEIIDLKTKIKELSSEPKNLDNQKTEIIDYFENKIDDLKQVKNGYLNERNSYQSQQDQYKCNFNLLRNDYTKLLDELKNKENELNNLNNYYQQQNELFYANYQEEINQLQNYYNKLLSQYETSTSINKINPDLLENTSTNNNNHNINTNNNNEEDLKLSELYSPAKAKNITTNNYTFNNSINNSNCKSKSFIHCKSVSQNSSNRIVLSNSFTSLNNSAYKKLNSSMLTFAQREQNDNISMMLRIIFAVLDYSIENICKELFETEPISSNIFDNVYLKLKALISENCKISEKDESILYNYIENLYNFKNKNNISDYNMGLEILKKNFYSNIGIIPKFPKYTMELIPIYNEKLKLIFNECIADFKKMCESKDTYNVGIITLNEFNTFLQNNFINDSGFSLNLKKKENKILFEYVIYLMRKKTNNIPLSLYELNYDNLLNVLIEKDIMNTYIEDYNDLIKEHLDMYHISFKDFIQPMYNDIIIKNNMQFVQENIFGLLLRAKKIIRQYQRISQNEDNFVNLSKLISLFDGDIIDMNNLNTITNINLDNNNNKE